MILFRLGICHSRRERYLCRFADDSLPLRRRNGEIKCSGETASEAGQVHVRRTARRLRRLMGATRQQEARPFELGVRSGLLSKLEDAVAQLVVPTNAVPPSAASTRVVPFSVKDGVAEGAP